MERISDVQQVILDFIQNEINKKGYPPSVREICTAVGLKSTSTVHGHLTRLEKKGLLQRDPTKPRAIELLNDPSRKYKKDTAYIPIVDKNVSPQKLSSFRAQEEQALDGAGEMFPIPSSLLNQDAPHFVLNMEGDSMVDAGIFDGDFVIVRQQNAAEDGDIIVAVLDDEASVKRYYKEKNYIRLQPENPYMEPVIASSIDILGKVTGLFRKL